MHASKVWGLLRGWCKGSLAERRGDTGATCGGCLAGLHALLGAGPAFQEGLGASRSWAMSAVLPSARDVVHLHSKGRRCMPNTS